MPRKGRSLVVLLGAELIDRRLHHPQVAAGGERRALAAEDDRAKVRVAPQLLTRLPELEHQRGAEDVELVGVVEPDDRAVGAPLDRDELTIVPVAGGDEVPVGDCGHLCLLGVVSVAPNLFD